MFSWPTWSTTAPWSFSDEPRLLRHWKYCTVSEPWATACSDESACIPGRLTLADGIQFVALGTLSISMKGLPPLRQRLMSWTNATSAASATSSTLPVASGLCHSG